MSDDGDKQVSNEGALKEKLVRTKQQWAEDGRLITGNPDEEQRDRLPPGQRLVTNWPVLDLGIQPNIEQTDWKIEISGSVENPLSWSFDDLMSQPQFESVSDIHCVTAWSRYDNHWQGVSAQHILSLVHPAKDAKHIIFHSYDGYTTNVTLERFSHEDVLLAHSWEGSRLTREHGAPVRVIMPRWYFWKSAKWIKKIEFCSDDQAGFWEVRGYHNEGNPWTEERYS